MRGLIQPQPATQLSGSRTKIVIIIRTYICINLIFAGVIILIIFYSAVFSPSGNYPLGCVHESLTGESCPSCGLSHAFSLIVRGRLQEALVYNVYSMRLFLFFALQLIIRAGVPVIWLRLPDIRRRNDLVLTDAVVTAMMFAVAFYPMVRYIIVSSVGSIY